MLLGETSTPPHLNLSPRPRRSAFKQCSRLRTPPSDSLSSILQSPGRKLSPPTPPSKPARAASISPSPRGIVYSEDLLGIFDKFAIDQKTESPPSAPYYWSARIEFQHSSPPWLSPRVDSSNYQVKAPVSEEPTLLNSQNKDIVLQTLINEMITEAERMAATAFENGYQKAITTLLERCTFPSLAWFADRAIDSADLPPAMRNVLSLLGTGAPEPVQLISVWQPPTFDTAEDHISDLCCHNQEIVPLGILNGSSTKLSLHGYVLRYGDGENDLHNPCLLTIVDSGVSRKIPVICLGTILGSGTAVLLDRDQNVWLYSPTLTIDDTIPNLDGKAGIVLRKGEVGSFEKLVIFDKVYDADVTVVEDEND